MEDKFDNIETNPENSEDNKMNNLDNIETKRAQKEEDDNRNLYQKIRDRLQYTRFQEGREEEYLNITKKMQLSPETVRRDLGQIGIDGTTPKPGLPYFLKVDGFDFLPMEQNPFGVKSRLGTLTDKYVLLSYGDIEIMFDICSMDIDFQKNIKPFDFPSSYITAIEWISTKSPIMALRAQIVSPSRKTGYTFPLKELDKLRKLYDIQDMIEIESTLLNELGYFDIIINNMKIDENEQYANVIDVRIDCYLY